MDIKSKRKRYTNKVWMDMFTSMIEIGRIAKQRLKYEGRYEQEMNRIKQNRERYSQSNINAYNEMPIEFDKLLAERASRKHK